MGLRSLQRAQRVCQPDVALRVTVFAAGCTSWPSPGSSRGRRILHWTQHTRGAALCRVALVIAAGSRPRRLRSLCLWPRGRKCRDSAGAMQGRIPPLISSLLLLRRGAGLVWAAFVICLIFAYDEGYWVVSVPFLPRECPCHCALPCPRASRRAGHCAAYAIPNLEKYATSLSQHNHPACRSTATGS